MAMPGKNPGLSGSAQRSLLYSSISWIPKGHRLDLQTLFFCPVLNSLELEWEVKGLLLLGLIRISCCLFLLILIHPVFPKKKRNSILM